LSLKVDYNFVTGLISGKLSNLFTEDRFSSFKKEKDIKPLFSLGYEIAPSIEDSIYKTMLTEKQELFKYLENDLVFRYLYFEYDIQNILAALKAKEFKIDFKYNELGFYTQDEIYDAIFNLEFSKISWLSESLVSIDKLIDIVFAGYNYIFNLLSKQNGMKDYCELEKLKVTLFYLLKSKEIDEEIRDEYLFTNKYISIDEIKNAIKNDNLKELSFFKEKGSDINFSDYKSLKDFFTTLQINSIDILNDHYPLIKYDYLRRNEMEALSGIFGVYV
jgi:hypothetical protein